LKSENPKLRQERHHRRMVGICRSYGAKFILGLWFYKDVAPDGAGGGCSGRPGAEAQWLFMPEPDTRKTRRTRAAKHARTPDKFKS
jgi:hypothetical protein